MLVIPEEYKVRLKQVQLSVVIPVYNQENHIASCLSKIKKILDSTLLTCEIIVVNDGSKDNTLDILKKEEKSDSRIKVISYVQNMGKGNAVKCGILQSCGSMVMFVDGDMEIDSSTIINYANELENCDLVIASKIHPSSQVIVPISRKLLSRAFNVLVRITTGIKLRDTQSGLKVGNGDAIRMIFKIMSVKRYAFDVELLTIATMLNMEIKEMPVTMKINRRFKINEIFKMLQDLLGISYRYRIKRYYQNQFKMMKIMN